MSRTWLIIGTLFGVSFATILTVLFLVATARPTDVWVVQDNSSDFEVRFVSGTEYFPDQDGQVIVEVRAVNGSSLSANCTAYVWYPNKTVFINNQSMLVDNGTGNAYVGFTVPWDEGVYEYQARCYARGKTAVASKSFHVGKAMRGWVTQ